VPSVRGCRLTARVRPDTDPPVVALTGELPAYAAQGEQFHADVLAKE
jgi:hypothetical protein